VSDRLTFLAVHAHPDDEASSTGGTFRLLKDQGVRTVLVTCTNGEFGDDLSGNKPDHDDHDPAEVAAHRRGELEQACEILGIDRLVMLGYHDSGMRGWEGNEMPESFWSTPVAEAAERLAAVLREERPQVVMTYNESGFYGHPDHIQANRVTLAALELIDYEPTLYYNAIPDSVMERYRARWAEEARREAEERAARGEEAPEDSGPPVDEDGEPIRMGTPDDEIGAAIDITAVTDAKFDALAAHHSQIGDSGWMRMGREEFKKTMTTEWFVRVRDPHGRTGLVDDLFVDYR
jgi:LmbE family N-acetylglucosaminyl deacetylase